MSHAYDALAISNASMVSVNTSLKLLLRMLIIKGKVTLTFDDGSQLVYRRTKSWRTDRLEIKDAGL